MPLLALALLFGSALLHTSWNLLLKQAGEKYIATFWTVVLGGLIFAPVLFFTGLPARELWPLVLVSSLIEVLYFLTLASAYKDHDFALVYPLARGAAPAFLAIWSLLLLRERPTAGGLAGLALIVCGLMLVGGSSLFARGVHRPAPRPVLIALLNALLISVYTLIDGYAVKHGPAVPYAIAIFTLIPVLITPVIVYLYPRRLLLAELSAHWRRQAAIAVLGVFSYLVALLAFAIASLSYAGAVREVSVVLGAFAGWWLLRERFGGVRLTGAAVIFAGILMIAVSG